MFRKTPRAGAFATVLMLMITLFAVQGSGAAAKSEDFQVSPLVQQDLAAPASEVPAATEEALPQFVSEPVIQPLPAIEEMAADSLHELVAEYVVEEDLSRDLRCLAQAIYFEARGEDLAGQLAVAQVIINRTRSPQFPDNYCSVVLQRAQFSFVRNGRIPTVAEGSRAWQRAKAIAQIAHRDLWESEAEDALFFHATYVKPGWARTKSARATIDSHIFYR